MASTVFLFDPEYLPDVAVIGDGKRGDRLGIVFIFFHAPILRDCEIEKSREKVLPASELPPHLDKLAIGSILNISIDMIVVINIINESLRTCEKPSPP